ncbi:MAG: TIGR02677 family protein [Actinobacteria bacterium]|nr:TIGR02677 family protein [Actinomycetota bacterium]
MAESDQTPGGRPSLVACVLDADERTQLQVLRAATEGSAPLYGAVLAVLVAAKERYQVQVRTEEIARELAAHGLDTATLGPALEQLKDWGAVTWTQDTSRVARLEDFHRRRELWQLTAAGHAAHGSVLRVLGAAEQAGSLQRALFRDIRENLDTLAAAVDAGDTTATYLRLRDLDGALRDLAANARDFHATMAQLRREHELDPERFLAYKHLLIDYLQQFLDDLSRYRVLIAGQVAAVEGRGLDRLVELAAAGDDSAGLFADDDLAARWRERWRGLAGWFPIHRSGSSRAGGADELMAATTAAIRDLMAFLRKLTESATRPITRASELLQLARWFARCEPGEAHRLFDAAFGLAEPYHLGQEEHDPDRTPTTTSWWEAAPVEVPVTIREYGRRAPAPPPSAAADYREAKARLAAEHRRRRAARVEAAARLTARPIDERVLTESEFSLLLELLDRALHQRPMSGDCKVEVEAEGVRLIVATADMTTSVTTGAGTLRLPGVELDVHRL